MLNDPTVYKTEVLKGTNTGDFKFTRQFTYFVTPQVNKAQYFMIFSAILYKTKQKSFWM